MSQLQNLFSSLNQKVNIEYYHFIFEQYPEIELERLAQFMNSMNQKFTQIENKDLSEYYYALSEIFEYKTEEEGYWIAALISHEELLCILNKNNLSEKALTVITQLYAEYPNFNDPLFEWIDVLEGVPKNKLQSVFSVQDNAKNLITLHDKHSERLLPKRKITRLYKKRVFEILPVSIVSNKELSTSLINNVSSMWIPKQFKYLIDYYRTNW